mmetsp:Transcript_5587/g.18285  ORF Transcript_5587/g.18285 Transcript_5587/m.18285 type:complete len:232 (-) Transcript_5587:201-896(-)
MGNNLWFLGGPLSSSEPLEDLPWIVAIRDVAYLDYRKGLSAEEAIVVRKRQSTLPVEILPHLFLSSARAASDVESLRLLRVTHAINAAGFGAAAQAATLRSANVKVLELPARDVEGYPMLPRHFERTRRFVKHAKDHGGRVVVFCVAGVNRSGVLCAAEYMLDRRVDVLEAVAHCRKARGNVCLSNHSFQAQLVALARKEGLLGPIPQATTAPTDRTGPSEAVDLGRLSRS